MNKNIIMIGLILSVILIVGCVQTPPESYPSIEGNWILRHYSWEGNLTETESVQIERDNDIVTIFSGDEVLCNGTIIKNNQTYPKNHTDNILKCNDFRGLGVNVIFIYNESYLETELPLCESCNPSIFTKE
ncbi:MAG: hypothetical protein JSW06_08820 [Thermoplasmatales archaeon]|nr:MAG: hypothetical protein JSW06_08820 [Thermoplasmatales archaeon]